MKDHRVREAEPPWPSPFDRGDGREELAVERTLTAYPDETDPHTLVGLVLRVLRGQANPALISELVRAHLARR